MEEKNQIVNLGASNRNTDDIVNKIQNSLERLQTAINNRQIFDNINNSKKNIPNKNITSSKRTIDTQEKSKKENPSMTSSALSNPIYDENYLSKNNYSGFNTDKRSIQRKINQYRYLNNINSVRTNETIMPQSTPGRNVFYNKINYNYNNRNRNRMNNNIGLKKKCIKCGNINPPKSKFCFNCGEPLINANKKNINLNNNNHLICCNFQDLINQSKIIILTYTK